ncbi:hypothetical protein [Cyclobacterium xiamenense]|uniref:hypothetical protein n=1 Tax=Cyclobacterium xiamenense TaxID=1297121 RepID=UPI0035CEB417
MQIHHLIFYQEEVRDSGEPIFPAHPLLLEEGEANGEHSENALLPMNSQYFLPDRLGWVQGSVKVSEVARAPAPRQWPAVQFRETLPLRGPTNYFLKPPSAPNARGSGGFSFDDFPVRTWEIPAFVEAFFIQSNRHEPLI